MCVNYIFWISVDVKIIMSECGDKKAQQTNYTGAGEGFSSEKLQNNSGKLKRSFGNS